MRWLIQVLFSQQNVDECCQRYGEKFYYKTGIQGADKDMCIVRLQAATGEPKSQYGHSKQNKVANNQYILVNSFFFQPRLARNKKTIQ